MQISLLFPLRVNFNRTVKKTHSYSNAHPPRMHVGLRWKNERKKEAVEIPTFFLLSTFYTLNARFLQLEEEKKKKRAVDNTLATYQTTRLKSATVKVELLRGYWFEEKLETGSWYTSEGGGEGECLHTGHLPSLLLLPLSETSCTCLLLLYSRGPVSLISDDGCSPGSKINGRHEDDKQRSTEERERWIFDEQTPDEFNDLFPRPVFAHRVPANF